MHHEYWDSFYRSRDSVAVPRDPSPFAQWVREQDPHPHVLVDIGTGTGRDALWFARRGQRVLGLDYAPAAVAQAAATADAERLPATFETFDLYDADQVLTTGARLASSGAPPTLYGRFLLHALEDDGRRNLWRLAEVTLRDGGRMYLEFRTGKDAEAAHVFGEHFRRFLDPDTVVDEIEAGDGRVEYRGDGHGMAPFRGEDPHICRLVVGWRR